MRPDNAHSERSGESRLSVAARRRALRLGYANGALWSAGNGLTSGPLVYFLAQELGARGTGLSVLIAAPSLVGLLRLVTPAVIGPLGGLKATCLKASLASYLLLTIGLALAPLGDRVVSRTALLAALITLVCVHQLLEYVGSVALWSWLGALAPARVRGRYFGRRNLWQLLCLIPTLLASGRFVDHWKALHEGQPAAVLVGYIIAATIGGCFLLLSLLPLLLMPDVPAPRGNAPARGVGRLALAPLVDRRFRAFLTYRVWFSFFNGLTQAAQNVFLYRVLGLGVGPVQQMQLGMRVGQMALSPAVGAAADRYGNRPVLELSQGLVAAGLLFYAVATPNHAGLVVGAYVLWTAYAGLNVCLNNLTLRLAPVQESASYIATIEAASGLAFGLSTIAGGLLLDRLQARGAGVHLGELTLDHFAILFAAGAILRAAGVFWLSRVDEPGAKRWREIGQQRSIAS